MMNPETNRFEEVHMKEIEAAIGKHTEDMTNLGFVRSDGSDVPFGYPIFGVGEEFELKGYRFKVKLIKEDELVLEPVGPVSISKMRSGVYIKKGTGSSKKKRKSGSRKKK